VLLPTDGTIKAGLPPLGVCVITEAELLCVTSGPTEVPPRPVNTLEEPLAVCEAFRRLEVLAKVLSTGLAVEGCLGAEYVPFVLTVLGWDPDEAV